MAETKQPQTGFVDVNGTKLYYEMLGEGHPLMLIHGGYMDRRMWDDQFAVFAEHYKVIRYDVRGFGKSEMPQIPYSNVEDLYALLNHLNITKTYLLGLSLGGMIAIDFTLEHPHMVEALVLVGSPMTGFPATEIFSEEELQQYRHSQKQRWAAFENAIKERNIPAMVDALMQDPTLVPPPGYTSAHERVRNNLSEYSFVFVLDPAPKQDITPVAYVRLSEIRVPTLIVVGSDDDILLHRFADKLERDIVDTKRVTIPETHHMPNMEKPEEFNRIVLAFLREV